MGFAIILGFLLVGVVLQRLNILPASAPSRLIQYVLYIAMPALVLLHLPQLQIDAQLWVPVITPWAMLALSMISVVVLTRLLNWSREVMGALLIVVPLGNTSFLGFPIVRSFYGEQGLAYAVLYDQFGSFIGLAVVATTLAAIFSHGSSYASSHGSSHGLSHDMSHDSSHGPSNGMSHDSSHGLSHGMSHNKSEAEASTASPTTTSSPTAAKPHAPAPNRPKASIIIKKVLTFPPFIALLVALVVLLSETSYPATLETLLQVIGMTLVPAVMVAVGLQLQFSVPKADVSPFFASLILKLLVLPLVAMLVFWLSPLSGLPVKVAMLEAAMPPMITAGAIAMAAGLKPRLVSAIIGYGVICSAVTIPIWYAIVEQLF